VSYLPHPERLSDTIGYKSKQMITLGYFRVH
jgi:hypothetical protein